jgi:hypothetical protein
LYNGRAIFYGEKLPMSVYAAPKAPRQISRLAKLYEKGQVSDLAVQTLNKLVTMEISQGRADLADTEKDLLNLSIHGGRENVRNKRNSVGIYGCCIVQ